MTLTLTASAEIASPPKVRQHVPPVAPPGLNEQSVRAALLAVWGEQACRRPADWPRVLEELLRGRKHDEKDFDEHGQLKARARYPRASLLPWIDEATRVLTKAFADGVPQNPADTVWRAFSKLDRASCVRLADRLTTLARDVQMADLAPARLEQPEAA
jgi:hypothetical protein